MLLKSIPLNEVDRLPKFEKEGGQGEIYSAPNEKLIKIYPSESPEEATKISNRLETLGHFASIYQGLEHFCAVPEALIQRQDNRQFVGFQMRHFSRFEPISSLQVVTYCLEKHVTTRRIVNMFLTLHDLFCLVHNRGLIIGDASDENFLMRLSGQTAAFAFIDVDCWGVKRPEFTLPTNAKTRTFNHPEIDEHPEKFEKYHDWYSFAVLLSRSLIKSDPFNTGMLDDDTMRLIKGTSQAKGITCWDPRVILTKKQEIYIKRFGQSMTDTLIAWLSGKQRKVFPKKALHDFLRGLCMCERCKLEVHISHGNCTKCGEKLKLLNFPKSEADPIKEPEVITSVWYYGR